jgi:hypothetical protein
MKAVSFTDEQLVSAIRDKDRANEAISYIYQSYFETLNSLIVHHSGSRQDSARSSIAFLRRFGMDYK